MTAAAGKALDYLRARGVQIRLDDGDLVITGSDNLSGAEVARLRELKPEIIETLQSVSDIQKRVAGRIGDLRADPSKDYPVSGVVHSGRESEMSDLYYWQLVERLLDGGIGLSVEGDGPHLTWWSSRSLRHDLQLLDEMGAARRRLITLISPHSISHNSVIHAEDRFVNATSWDDPEHGQRVADERNAAAERAGRTDRYCACQRHAESQWQVGRRRIWRCDACRGEVGE